MTKIILDIVLIILFVAIAVLQVYVIRKIKDLKKQYKSFTKAEHDFMKSIDKARQSLMLVNSQATDVLPELKLCIDKSEGLMQDFSFIIARANRKINQLQDVTSEVNKPTNMQTDNNTLERNSLADSNINQLNQITEQANITNEKQGAIEEPADPIMARLARQENYEPQMFESKTKSSLTKQEELIEKALKEIL
ncbi:MAG: hypothetical protein GY793_00925 [Proteobacteria bacterium]|nr:hypothetical protein [Pseudomonadota bacterium]